MTEINIQNIIESLRPYERKLIPFLESSKTLDELDEKSNLGKAEILRSLEFLSNKNIIKLK